MTPDEIKDARALVDRLSLGGDYAHDTEPMHDAADALTTALDEIERLREALKECELEIDSYIRQEYPFDHPVQERLRKRDFAANPARAALNPEGET